MECTEYCLVMIVVNRGFSDVVMEAAKKEGAKGGTIVHARGTGKTETHSFMGMEIQPEKDLVLILTETENKKAIMKAISEQAGLNQEGNGIVFALPVEEVIGAITKK